MLPTEVFPLTPGVFFLTDVHLDYTLVAVQPQAAGREVASRGWNRLIGQTGKVIVGESLNIIQHPNGEPKQLALRENKLVDVLEQFLHYKTDTAPGSSGSPVFNDQWEVVALHHSGVPSRDHAGRILTRDGKIWEPWMGEHRVHWIANEGARISRIIKHIKSQPLSPEQQHLREQMLDAEPPPASIEKGPVQSQPPAPPIAGISPTAVDDSGITWTIPLQVTVRLGEAGARPNPPPPAGSIPHVPQTAAAPAEFPAPPKEAPPEDEDVQAALAELERSRSLPYYDQDKDEQDRSVYYQNLDPEAESGTLYHQLRKLLDSTHAERMSYKPSRYVYPWVDLHPDRKLRSIYSGKAFDPEDFIREDFAITLERGVHLRELVSAEELVSEDQLNEALDMLEATLPYNCEHVVPRSWFGKKQPMVGDLHHLFACERNCNSFRSNIPYYDFPDFEEAVREECGKRVGKKFEPNSGKGAVARATLYFLIRYPGQINDTEKEFSADRLPMLLEWHRRFPVDQYERHRNMAIFQKQGNRNPFIDFPDLAERIDFELGLGD